MPSICANNCSYLPVLSRTITWYEGVRRMVSRFALASAASFSRVHRRVGMELELDLIALEQRAQIINSFICRRMFIAAIRFSTRVGTGPKRSRISSRTSSRSAVDARAPSADRAPAARFRRARSCQGCRPECRAQFRLEVRPRRLAAQFSNRLLHHLGIELESHRRDFARLFAAEQIAGAAMFEVANRELETGAAFGLDQLAQGVDAPLGLARDDVLAGNQQISIGLALARPTRPRNW